MALLPLLLLLLAQAVIADEIATGSAGVDILDLLGVTDQATRTRIAEQAEAERRGAAGRRFGLWGVTGPTVPAAADGLVARASCPPALPLATSIIDALRKVLMALPGGMLADALGSRPAVISALANAQVPAVAERAAALTPALENDETLLEALLVLIPAAVSASELHVAYEALRILDKRITDRPGKSNVACEFQAVF